MKCTRIRFHQSTDYTPIHYIKRIHSFHLIDLKFEKTSILVKPALYLMNNKHTNKFKSTFVRCKKANIG